MNVTEIGRRPLAVAGVTTPVSINASTILTLPTPTQRIKGGTLEATVVIEGTVTSRFTLNGVTPTAAVGHLLPAPTATVPVTLMLRGEAVASAFRIIGTAAGNTITYFFAVADTR